jgi:hypothetical protein
MGKVTREVLADGEFQRLGIMSFISITPSARLVATLAIDIYHSIRINLRCRNKINMRQLSIFTVLTGVSALLVPASPTPPSSLPLSTATSDAAFLLKSGESSNVSIPLFVALEELSRIVDISYCVGTSGITHPFKCASRCDEFPDFELITEFNTGPLMSDSCGYVVLDHGKVAGREGSRTEERQSGGVKEGRIIVAFRGTYSIANTIVDLSTVPQEYVPYPGSPGNDSAPHDAPKRTHHNYLGWIPGFKTIPKEANTVQETEKRAPVCNNCTVHSGFWQSWQNTRSHILPHLEAARFKFPGYQLHLVGHSLGGAVAALAGLEMDTQGWNPIVTTFGEPRVGNTGLRRFIDQTFGLPFGKSSRDNSRGSSEELRYRRVTHVDDPVPLLPLLEWGYKPHAGEVYIAKSALQPGITDLQVCHGDEDAECSFGAESPDSWLNAAVAGLISASTLSPSSSEEKVMHASDTHETSLISNEQELSAKLPAENDNEFEQELRKRWGIPIPSRYKMWQLFFAHRDYFWRLGLCVKGGDPSDWGRDKYKFPTEDESTKPQ